MAAFPQTSGKKVDEVEPAVGLAVRRLIAKVLNPEWSICKQRSFSDDTDVGTSYVAHLSGDDA
jgi:hypothetical protein